MFGISCFDFFKPESQVVLKEIELYFSRECRNRQVYFHKKDFLSMTLFYKLVFYYCMI